MSSPIGALFAMAARRGLQPHVTLGAGCTEVVLSVEEGGGSVREADYIKGKRKGNE